MHIFHKLSLYVAFPIEIELKIEHGGLDIVMAQVIFDISDGFTLIEHIECTGMTEAMNEVEVFEAFGGKCFREILFADMIDTVSGEFFTPLIDKEPVLVEGFWGRSVFSNIEFEEL